MGKAVGVRHNKIRVDNFGRQEGFHPHSPQQIVHGSEQRIGFTDKEMSKPHRSKRTLRTIIVIAIVACCVLAYINL